MRVARPALRRLLSAITLAVFMMASMGVMPNPATLSRWLGGTAERHPCEGHSCGCGSAHDCWTNCCCHTPEQRLAWAIREGVQPPAFVKYTQAQWIAAANAVKPGSASCGGCVAGVQAKLARGEKGCGEACGEATRTASTSGASISALGCKAQGSLLAFTVPFAMPAAHAITLVALPRPDFGRPVAWRLPACITLDTNAPPPRAA